MINYNFCVYLTGGGRYKQNVINYAKRYGNIKIVNDYGINDVKIDQAYYKSVQNYDDKIIPYVFKYASDGDFVWNVAADEVVEFD